MSLITELKRRNVFKVGAAYLALAWIVVQITATLTPAFHLPESALPLVTWIGVIGFPFAVVFAWVYELTPEGLKRESEVDRSRSVTQQTGRKLDYLIVALLVAAIGLFLFDRFVPREGRAQGALDTPSSPVGAGHARDTSADNPAEGAPPQPQPATTPDAKSIAVLPFVNMSEDANNAYFADGISEELLNLLAKIPELQVTSRSSAFAFKGKEIDIPVVAAKLNVAHVLEGSVRKSGNKVRITAQLVDARSDKHLWSETYDRELDDIFAVQDEIAAAVVEQLRVKLLGAAPKAKVVKPEAYALFLQARQLRRQNTAGSLEQAIALAQEAIRIDPSYAEAWDELSRSYMNQASVGLRPGADALALSRDAVGRALAIDPDLARAHDSLGWIAGTYDIDIAEAARHYTRALELAPGDTNILANAAGVLWGLGRMDDVIVVLEYVVARDPLVTIGMANLAGAYLTAGRYDDAIARARLLLSLAPDYLGAHVVVAGALLLRGDAQAALAEAALEPDPVLRLQWTAMAAHSLGKQAESDAALGELAGMSTGTAAYARAAVRSWRGEADPAFAELEKAIALREPAASGLNNDPPLVRLHDDPRWLPLLRRLRLDPEYLATIRFEVKLP